MKPIEFNPNYSITEHGEVVSTVRLINGRPKYLKGLIKSDGYKLYFLKSDKPGVKNRWFYAHRLVAMAYIDNPNNLSDVDHIDNDKLNNHISNLQWISHRDNILKSYQDNNRKIPKGESHYLYGKKRSQEIRNKLSKCKAGINHPKFKGYFIVNNVRYDSANAAGKAINMNPKLVSELCKNGFNPNYQFEPVIKTAVREKAA